MVFLKYKELILFLIIYFFCNTASSQNIDKYPGTPSSTYKSDYYFSGDKKFNNEIQKREKLKILNENPKKQKQLTFIISGNNRIDNAVIIRDSKIDTFDVIDQKALSKIIKNLYSTGYFNDVKIFKDNNVINIAIKENPIIN